MGVSEADYLLKEAEPQLVLENKEGTSPVVYTRRWYMVLIFGSLGCLQSALCVVWLVVAESAEAAFGWTNSDLSIMQIWIYVTFLLGVGPFALLIQSKGMRVSTILAAILLFLGTLCRIITSSPPWVTCLAHVGHMFTGISAPVLFAGSPVMSATWFPPGQRATATAIMTTFSLSGTALIFLVDPQVVPAPIMGNVENSTQGILENISNISEIRTGLMNLRYTEFGIATLLLVLTVVYFPAKPPSAPSVSATVDKLAFIKSLRQLFSCLNANFWCVAVPAAISSGLFGVFGSMLDVNLREVGVSQTSVGWLSFLGTAGSSITGIIIGRLGDKFIGRRKIMLLTMTAIGVLSSLVFALIVGQYISFNIVAVYVSYVLLAAAVNGALPLYYETSIETTFPISEGITMGVITMAYNILPIAFLVVPLLPDIGTSWMNWFMFGSLLFCLPLLIVYKERYDRLSLDHETVDKQ